jgi:flagellar export protein FliJ
MRGLPTLIRAQKWRVDAMRREIGELEGLLAQRRAEAIRLEEEVVEEQKRAAGDPVGLWAYAGGYAAGVIVRRAAAARAIAAAEAEVAERRAVLAELFAELKRYEIVRDRLDAREAQEAARRDAIALDELSIEMYRRREA